MRHAIRLLYGILAAHTPTGGSAPALIGHNASTSGGSVVASLAVLMPVETIPNGSKLTAYIAVRDAAATVSATGWTHLSGSPQATTTGRLHVMERVSDGTEGSSVTFTLSAGTSKVCGIIVAVAAGTIEVPTFNTALAASTASSTCTAPAVTTAGANRRLIVVFMGEAGSSPFVSSVNGPDASLLRASQNTGAASVCLAMGSFTKATAGLTSAQTATLSAAMRNIGFTLAIG